MTIRELFENYGRNNVDGEDFLKYLMIFEETSTFEEFIEANKEEFELDENEVEENIEWYKGFYNDLIEWENQR